MFKINDLVMVHDNPGKIIGRFFPVRSREGYYYVVDLGVYGTAGYPASIIQVNNGTV